MRGRFLPVHGQVGTRLYRIWGLMKSRCFNPRNDSYPRYGGRGITVVAQWRSFPEFREWAIGAGYDDGLTIERKDVNGHYSPDNCCWIPPGLQARNRENTIYLTAFGERKTIPDWVADERCKVGAPAVRTRLKKGWSVELALVTPISEQNRVVALPDESPARTIAEWARSSPAGVNPETLRKRLARGWKIGEALDTARQLKGRKFEIHAFGETKTLEEWLEDPRCIPPERTIRERIRHGWSPRWALSTPLRHRAKNKSASETRANGV